MVHCTETTEEAQAEKTQKDQGSQVCGHPGKGVNMFVFKCGSGVVSEQFLF